MDIDKYIQTVLRAQLLTEQQIKILCRAARELLFQQSNIQPVKCPVSVCGDVHGQFYDLKELFHIGGQLLNTSQRYIMIGDFVDRGYNSVETICLLFCYKVKYPDRIVLLRGNHQSRRISFNYGFYEEVQQKYGNPNVWNFFNDAFDYLPIGAIIQGQIFCVHGGLSPQISSIDQMRSIQRNMQIPSSGPFSDLMWSDPSSSPEIDCWQMSDRGAGWVFGQKVVQQFLHGNGLKMIVRAHQLAHQGYTKHFNGLLYTIWSAPNYCYRMGNDAAIMKINQDFQHEFSVFKASKLNKTSQHYSKVMPYFL